MAIQCEKEYPSFSHLSVLRQVTFNLDYFIYFIDINHSAFATFKGGYEILFEYLQFYYQLGQYEITLQDWSYKPEKCVKTFFNSPS